MFSNIWIWEIVEIKGFSAVCYEKKTGQLMENVAPSQMCIYSYALKP